MSASMFFWIPPDPEGYFQASVVKSALLETTPSPRIILIGGSNVAFGIDSELMEARLGMPVINMGIHGGIGESSYLEVFEQLRSGDIVILMPEYIVFGSDVLSRGNDVILAEWIEYDLERLRLLSPQRVPDILLAMLRIKATRQAASLFLSGDFDRGVFIARNFNSHGDFIGHIDINQPIEDIQNGPYFSSIDDFSGAFAFFKQFNLGAQGKGAVVYFEFPASRAQNCLQTGREQIKKFYSALLRETNIPVLTALGEICYPNSYFYDTNYHLNGVGRQAMTERVIKDLLPYLP